MPLNEDFCFTTRFRAGSEGEIIDETVYRAKRTPDGFSVGIWTKGKYEYCVEFPYDDVIGFLNDAEWVIEYERD